MLAIPYFKDEFIKLGYNTVAAGYYKTDEIILKPQQMHINDVLKKVPFKPDLIFLGDDSRGLTFLGLEDLDIPLIWYAVDSHIHYNWHGYYACVFDYIFVAQKEFVIYYKAGNPEGRVSWLPLFARDRIDKNLNLKRDINVSFVGKLNRKINTERVDFFERLKKRCDILVTSGDYVEIFNRSKIVVNQSYKNDINLRVFQTCACGSLLLSDTVTGLNDLFNNNVDIVTYKHNDDKEAAEKIEKLLLNPVLLENISKSGYNKTLSNHTAMHRTKHILEILNNLDFTGIVKRRLRRKNRIKKNINKILTFNEK